MKSISEPIEDMDVSEVDVLISCPELKAQGECPIQLIQTNQFDLNQSKIKRTRQGANPNLAQILRKNFIMNFKPTSLNMGVL